jgi:hypothetical protein
MDGETTNHMMLFPEPAGRQETVRYAAIGREE